MTNLEANQVHVKVEWAAASARDLIYLESGWLAQIPKGLGRNFAGVVVGLGANVTHLVLGDQVFGCVFEPAERKSLQIDKTFLTAPRECVVKIPSNVAPEAAATIPSSFISAFQAINTGLKLPLPWPNSLGNRNPQASSMQLIWGAGGSTSQHIVQLLRYYGFDNRLVVAAVKHHAQLQSVGATQVFDQTDPRVAHLIFKATLGLNHGSCPPGRFVVDLLASQRDSVQPIAALANPGARVAMSVPISGDQVQKNGDRNFFLDPLSVTRWRPGVSVNAFRPQLSNLDSSIREGLQSHIMPELVASSVITAADFEQIQGGSLEDRVQKATALAHVEGIQGKSFVWRVGED